MYDKVFENECDKIIIKLDAEKLVSANRFVTLAINTSKKYPRLFLPEFLEDYIKGMPSVQLIRKYELYNFNNLSSIVRSIRLESRRRKSHDMDCKKENLQDPEQREQYKFLSKHARMLHKPLVGMLNYNILLSLVSYSILEHEYITNENLQAYIKDAYNKVGKEIAILSDKHRMDSFVEYMGDNLHTKIHEVISNLHEQDSVVARDGDVSVTSYYPKFAEHVYEILKGESNGISHASLQHRVFDIFPLFRLTASSSQIFENILDGLNDRRRLIRKKFWKYPTSQDQLFTEENYAAAMAKIKNERLASGKTMFFGRRISPELFMDELKSLKYGDLDDGDDQVTRIAGLILSDAVMLQSPREDMDEFDFVVDLANYDFRPEQEEMMRKLDFSVRSTIFHCKVMIDSSVTPSILSRLADAVPAGEQAIIFTCRPIRHSVHEKILDDKTVQIIDEDAIRNWCTITPVIPCRKNSVARIRYGVDMGKIVLVKSLNYESGLATVETIPDDHELLIPIGSIEEMLPAASSLADFEALSDNYLDFLHLLADASQGSFENGMGMHVVGMYSDYEGFLRNTRPELFSEAHPRMDIKRRPKSITYVQFENLHTEVNTNPHSTNFFECVCNHHLNEEHYRTLCPHVVAAINHLCLSQAHSWLEINKKIVMFREKITRFHDDNMKRMIEAIYGIFDPESRSLFIEYLHRHA